MESSDLSVLRSLTDGLDQLISRAMQERAQVQSAHVDSESGTQGMLLTLEDDVIEGEFQES